MSITQAVIEKLETLPLEEQQEVLAFIESLQRKRSLMKLPQTETSAMSALEAAGTLVGCVKGGPPDLSTNKQYMEGFGEA